MSRQSQSAATKHPLFTKSSTNQGERNLPDSEPVRAKTYLPPAFSRASHPADSGYPSLYSLSSVRRHQQSAMPSLSSPWFQQKGSDATSSAARPKPPSSMSVEEQEALSARLSKPTESARQRRALFWKMDGFMDTGRHSWNKMELFEDCKKCMWTPSGSIKKETCKIRPTKMIPNKPGPAPGV